MADFFVISFKSVIKHFIYLNKGIKEIAIKRDFTLAKSGLAYNIYAIVD